MKEHQTKERRNKFSKGDFNNIKHMQKLGWKIETIMDKTSWSRKTVQRALESSTWSVYRSKISRENKKIREAREARKMEAMGYTPDSSPSFLEDGEMKPSPAAGQPKKKDLPIGPIIAIVVIVLTLLLYLVIK